MIRISMLEDKMERVVVGEALVAYNKVDFLKIENVIVDAKHEIIVLEEEEKSIHKKLESMKKVSGLSFWPKPIVHPSVHETSENPMYIIWLNIVDFCFWGIHCGDVAINFCKHTSHPFVLGELLRDNNICFICEQILPPNWMHSSGFCEEDDVMKKLAMDMRIDNSWEEMKRSLIETTSISIHLGKKKTLAFVNLWSLLQFYLNIILLVFQVMW
jgi:hypothetical protein